MGDDFDNGREGRKEGRGERVAECKRQAGDNHRLFRPCIFPFGDPMESVFSEGHIHKYRNISFMINCGCVWSVLLIPDYL